MQGPSHSKGSFKDIVSSNLPVHTAIPVAPHMEVAPAAIWNSQQPLTSDSMRSSLQITTVKLDENNYQEWSRSTSLYIGGQGKNCYLTGRVKKPSTDDPLFDKWYQENDLVMSWLCSSMTPHIRRTVRFLDTAVDIWSKLKKTYGQTRNVARIFRLKQEIHNLRQEELSVPTYYATLQGLWEELDHHQSHEWKCETDRSLHMTTLRKKESLTFLPV